VAGEMVSQAEAARRFGVARQSINELVARGVLPLVDGRVDMEVARVVLATRLDPARSKILREAADRRPEPTPAPLPVASAAGESPDAAEADDAAGITSYHTARTLREKYAALEARARYRQLCGTLVPADGVRLAITTAASNLRLALETIPDKLAPRLAAMSDEDACRALLDQAIAEALDALADMGDALVATDAEVAA
jgi:hypothetical protein